MRFKVGDKVRLCSIEQWKKLRDSLGRHAVSGFAPDMHAMSGMELPIASIAHKYYYIRDPNRSEDAYQPNGDKGWAYSEEMVEAVSGILSTGERILS